MFFRLFFSLLLHSILLRLHVIPREPFGIGISCDVVNVNIIGRAKRKNLIFLVVEWTCSRFVRGWDDSRDTRACLKEKRGGEQSSSRFRFQFRLMYARCVPCWVAQLRSKRGIAEWNKIRNCWTAMRIFFFYTISSFAFALSMLSVSVCSQIHIFIFLFYHTLHPVTIFRVLQQHCTCARCNLLQKNSHVSLRKKSSRKKHWDWENGTCSVVLRGFCQTLHWLSLLWLLADFFFHDLISANFFSLFSFLHCTTAAVLCEIRECSVWCKWAFLHCVLSDCALGWLICCNLSLSLSFRRREVDCIYTLLRVCPLEAVELSREMIQFIWHTLYDHIIGDCLINFSSALLFAYDKSPQYHFQAKKIIIRQIRGLCLLFCYSPIVIRSREL